MKIKRGYKIRHIAGESIIVQIGTLNVNLTKVISLNPTAEWLWNELEDEEFDENKVAQLLTSAYEVDEQTALRDGRAWIEALCKADLIEK